MYQNQSEGNGGIHLPHPISPAQLRTHRVQHTNNTLARFEFDDFERDLLFAAYGKDGVLAGMALYFGSPINAQRDIAKEAGNDAIKSGLVSTMESIRTRGIRETENSILGGYNIHQEMQRKYYGGRAPTMRVRNEDDDFSLAALEEIVMVMIMGQKLQ